MKLERILAVDDGVPHSEAAREYARRLATQLGATALDCAATTARAARDAAVDRRAQLVVIAGGSALVRELVEQTAVPVVLVPRALPADRPLWRAIVPLTGKADGDAALGFTVGLAQSLGMQVTAIHVADPHADRLEVAAQYADAPHHEYPSQLEEFVQRSLPVASAGERATLTELVLARGDALAELLRLVRERDADLLVAGWQGRMARPGSRLLERLTAALRCPLVIVKPPAHGPFQLKVGPDFE